jgi:DNA sulfur modification protein DndB
MRGSQDTATKQEARLDPFGYSFPTIRGVQAKREYYISMCPLRLIPKIFSFDNEELPPEMRAQRNLNEVRIPEIKQYILDNTEDYVFSALTASIDADVEFVPLGMGNEQRVGVLRVPMEARFIINDGQHRRAAIEAALRENPGLGYETIAVVFFMDRGLKRCQQMFADLNRYAVRPSHSIGVLYDHRDSLANLTKEAVFTSKIFRDLVETEKSSLATRSRKLFTLSSLYNANKELVRGWEGMSIENAVNRVKNFWETLALYIPEWNLVHERKITAGEVRRDFLHSHSLFLQAMGRMGHDLITEPEWEMKLKLLEGQDWSRSNPAWERRSVLNGRLSNSHRNVLLTTNVLKKMIGVMLNEVERSAEDEFTRQTKL